VGIPDASLQAIKEASAAVVQTTQPTEVLAGIFVTGEIPRQNDFEDVGGPFYLDRDCNRADPLADDQALFFDTPQGLVVVLGCAHAGVVNTLRYIGQLTNSRPIRAVLGGMHLLEASSERISQTLDALRELGVRQLGPAHCTGPAPTARLWSDFPDRCFACTVGSTLLFER
jgi:7,8-dihydropterin-6-yl-methyl-4-(beta-D-ribofuranosyl)aminobenzene 5'-phosphate synthase